MRYSTDWKDYELIDASSGERLERWGDVILIRPDPQIIWNTPKNNPLWRKAHARYHRSSSGGGRWEVMKKIPDVWAVRYKSLTFHIKPMGFKHTGLFRPVRVLNLFAYTGGATLACLSAGANVCHVDASKGMTQWARENAASSGLDKLPQRWIVDDCIKFVQREIRRGSRYDAVIMDPPSYGRGPGGEVWKLEEQVYSLVELCSQVLTDDPLFFNINSYTTGLSPSVMNYLNGAILRPKFGGEITADEIGLPVTETGLILPCGATASWRKSAPTDR